MTPECQKRPINVAELSVIRIWWRAQWETSWYLGLTLPKNQFKNYVCITPQWNQKWTVLKSTLRRIPCPTVVSLVLLGIFLMMAPLLYQFCSYFYFFLSRSLNSGEQTNRFLENMKKSNFFSFPKWFQIVNIAICALLEWMSFAFKLSNLKQCDILLSEAVNINTESSFMHNSTKKVLTVLDYSKGFSIVQICFLFW